MIQPTLAAVRARLAPTSSVPLGNLFAGGLALLFGAPVSLLVGACLALTAASVGWIKRSSAEKDLATSLD